MRNRPHWMGALDHRDWLFDGSHVRGADMIERFNKLDWSKAWVDLGPSVAGNIGPYWHVPLDWDGDETVHRLYPKVLLSKWLLLIRQACKEVIEKADSAKLAEENKRLRIDLASANIRIAELSRHKDKGASNAQT